MIRKFFKRLICIIMAIFFDLPHDIKRDAEKCNNLNEYIESEVTAEIVIKKSDSEIRSGKAAKLFAFCTAEICNCHGNIAESDFAMAKGTALGHYCLSRLPTKYTILYFQIEDSIDLKCLAYSPAADRLLAVQATCKSANTKRYFAIAF